MERARPAAPGDTARLVELCDEALAELSAQRGGPQLVRHVLGGRAVPDRLAGAMSGPDHHVVAGELSGAVVGIGIVHAHHAVPDPPAATVDVLYVEPGGRGVGLGEAIMDALTRWAEDRGCQGVDAMALPGNRQAKAFFEAHGLVARALVMHRSLPGRPAGGH